MTQEELFKLLKIDESYRIERTISTANMDKFQEAICAFANDLPGSNEKGYLFIGVNDDGTPSGLHVDDTLMKRISGIRSDGNILPLPIMNTEKVETADGDVLVVTVSPSLATPVRYRGRTFVRIGPRKDIASVEEERILSERNASHLASFDVMPCREATVNDIDIEFIKNKYLNQAIDTDILESDTRNIKEQLASLRLYNKHFNCPTMAAIILFGNNPKYFLPGCYIQYVKFDGTTKADRIINEKEFKGNLFSVLPRIDTFLSDVVVEQRPEVVSILREKTVSNYPASALRELLMNACMHRDYQSNTPIRFYQFSDRIEIMNAGGLYGEARPENFPNVNAYRNPIVAEAMKVMKYVNMFNRGVSRVQEDLQLNGSSPAQFNVDKLTVFEVIVESATTTNANANNKELSKRFEQLDDKIRNSIIALITNMKHEFYSSKELLELLNSARTPQELRRNSARSFMTVIIKPSIELNILDMKYQNSPHHPQQKYCLSEFGKLLRSDYQNLG